MIDTQVLTWYGQKKMDIIYGRMSAKETRLLVYSLIMTLPANMQPPMIDELAQATDQEVKDHAIKMIDDMGA